MTSGDHDRAASALRSESAFESASGSASAPAPEPAAPQPPSATQPAPENSLTYRQAGVDIDAGEALVEAIKPLARSPLRPGVLGGWGGFGALFDLKAAGFTDPILVSTTDGVGTKLRIAIET